MIATGLTPIPHNRAVGVVVNISAFQAGVTGSIPVPLISFLFPRCSARSHQIFRSSLFTSRVFFDFHAEMSNKATLKQIRQITAFEDISNAISQVFQDAQMSLSSHRKLVIVLKHIYERAIELEFEDGFLLRLTKMVNKILPLKKGEHVGDRIAKFCSLFVSTLFKDEEKNDEIEEENEEDSPANRVAEYLLRHLLRGLQAKDKNVRYRVVQLIAYLVIFVGEIDIELFKALRWSLNRRLYDKEPTIRIQAVVAMSRFQELVIPGEEHVEGHNMSTQKLIEAIQNDDSAEVRRSALLNLLKTPKTIPYLIERARDVNAINRRLVYSRIAKELGDFRNIDFELREELLKWGLNDRDDNVKKAASKMVIDHWFTTVNSDIISLIENLKVLDSSMAETAMKIFFKSRDEDLNSIDLPSSMWKELTTETAFLLRTFYDYCNSNGHITLIDDRFPEPVEIAETLEKYLKLRMRMLDENRELIEKYKRSEKSQRRIAAQLDLLAPEIVEAQEQVNEEKSKRAQQKLQKLTKDASALEEELRAEVMKAKEFETDYNEFSDVFADLEFVIKQLLLIAKDYDFSDEIGRRRMLQIVRSSLADDNLSSKLLELSLQVLRKISISERDFSSMCAEIINDLQDSYQTSIEDTIIGQMENDSEDSDEEGANEEESSPDSNQKRRRVERKQAPDELTIQCLRLLQQVLELVQEPLSSNYALESLIQSLVKPALDRWDHIQIRALGMKCMGLFCLLDQQLASSYLVVIGKAAANTQGELRVICIKAIVDILSVHGLSVVGRGKEVDSLSLSRLFSKILRLYDDHEAQAVVAEGLCKLFLADILNNFGNDEKEDPKPEDNEEQKLLTALILSYFHPYNSDNHALKQTLAFCIPVYAFSHPSHQFKLAKVSGDCFFRMFRVDGGYTRFDNFTTANAVMQQIVHWCDPNNLVNLSEEDILKTPSHVWQAVSMLQALEQDTPRSVKKTIITYLNKLYITEKLGSTVLRALQTSLNDTKAYFETCQNEPEFTMDASTEKMWAKFEANVQAMITKADEEEETSMKFQSSRTGSISESAASQTTSRRGSQAPSAVSSRSASRNASRAASRNSSRNTSRRPSMADEEDNVFGGSNKDEELAEIDKMLEQEELVDYDI